MPGPTLSVVVVSYNTRDATLGCLRSVEGQRPGFDVEVVLVDNASSDASADAVRSQHPRAVVLESGTNVGFARAVNRGVEAAAGDYVLLLNPDTVVLDGALATVVDFARRHPEHGLYGGRTLRPDGTLDPRSCWGRPTLWSLLCFATGLSTAFHGSAVLDPESLGRWARDTVREVPVVTGCFLLVRRSQLLELGGLDPVYFLYGEDADLSARARAAGLRPVLVPGAVIVHEVGASSAPGVKMPLVMAGKATLLRRTWPRRDVPLGLALLTAGVGLRALLETASRRRHRTWSAVWRARRDWLPGFPHAERLAPGSPTGARR